MRTRASFYVMQQTPFVKYFFGRNIPDSKNKRRVLYEHAPLKFPCRNDLPPKMLRITLGILIPLFRQIIEREYG